VFEYKPCSIGSRRIVKASSPGADSKAVSAEQMEISQLRAQLARVKMKRDIIKSDCSLL
jgi:transposase-like protein